VYVKSDRTRVGLVRREELSFHLKLHASHPPHVVPTTTTDISPYRNNFPELRYPIDCNMFIH
jgi:hypothetical protein